jgi:hypothetical protein
VEFSVLGLGTLQGALTIRAAYTPVSPTRVDISFTEATLVRAGPGGWVAGWLGLRACGC